MTFWATTLELEPVVRCDVTVGEIGQMAQSGFQCIAVCLLLLFMPRLTTACVPFACIYLTGMPAVQKQDAFSDLLGGLGMEKTMPAIGTTTTGPTAESLEQAKQPEILQPGRSNVIHVLMIGQRSFQIGLHRSFQSDKKSDYTC